MRSYNPKNADDVAEANKLLARRWQLEPLILNPAYTSWGNWEDYMAGSGNSGWDKPLEIHSVSDLIGLDELNELVNFYFTISRDGNGCDECNETGQNPHIRALSESWYSFDREEWVYANGGPRRYNNLAWQYHLTEVEIKALVQHGRLFDLMDKRYRFDLELNLWMTVVDSEWVPCEEPVYPTPDVVNEWAKGGFGHDSLNRWICVQARAESRGIDQSPCVHCNGAGHIYSGGCKLNLQMWILHPRKGCSRGVFLHDIQQKDLPQVIEYLKGARDRNSERFSKL